MNTKEAGKDLKKSKKGDKGKGVPSSSQQSQQSHSSLALTNETRLRDYLCKYTSLARMLKLMYEWSGSVIDTTGVPMLGDVTEDVESYVLMDCVSSGEEYDVLELFHGTIVIL